MSGCITCGRPTPRRKCRACEIDKRAEERAEHRDDDYPDCPSCGRRTSGEGVECYRCRRGDGLETDGGQERFSVRVGDLVHEVEEEVDSSTTPEALLYARCAAAFEAAANDSDLPPENAIGVMIGAVFEAADAAGFDRDAVLETAREHYVSGVDHGDGIETDGGLEPFVPDGGREECSRCGYLLANPDEPCPYCGADPDADDGDHLRPDGGSIRGLEAGDDIERHLQQVLDASDDQEARFHARHALQYLEADQGGTPMNLRKHALLGPCDDCGRIRRCRPVDGLGWACLECVPAGEGDGDLDAIASNGAVATDGGEDQ